MLSFSNILIRYLHIVLSFFIAVGEETSTVWRNAHPIPSTTTNGADVLDGIGTRLLADVLFAPPPLPFQFSRVFGKHGRPPERHADSYCQEEYR